MPPMAAGFWFGENVSSVRPTMKRGNEIPYKFESRETGRIAQEKSAGVEISVRPEIQEAVKYQHWLECPK